MHRLWGESRQHGGYRSTIFLTSLLCSSFALAQIHSFPYTEPFDSVSVPTLPNGWSTSSNRLATGDFFTTTTSPRSRPNALQSTNSTIRQTLLSPRFDLTGRVPSVLTFFTSRSGTHTSPVIIEASLDDGATFPLLLGDTLTNPGSSAYFVTSIPLPDTLANQSAVRFRWNVLGGTGGTTGTFRLDDLGLAVYTSFNLEIKGLTIVPVHPTTRDMLNLSVAVRNLGKQSASAYSIDFFLDGNGNMTAESFERFASISGADLNPGDSTTVTCIHPPLTSGEYRFIAALNFPSDEVKTNDTAMTSLHVSVAPGAVTINEIMYAPVGDEPEWVELFNASKDTIDLKDWRISDSNTNSKSFLTTASFVLPPSGYSIVAKDTMFRFLHPDVQVPVVITGFSALNNTSPDAVVLYESSLQTVDSVRYLPEWGGQNGISLERLDAFGSSVLAANWTSSTDSSGSTPGRANSVVRLDEDLALRNVTVNGSTFTILVKNVGRNTVSSFVVDLVTAEGGGRPFDSVPFSGLLHPDATAFLNYVWADPPAGETTVFCRINYSPDKRFRNDTLSVKVTRSFTHNSMIINEIMYEPASGQNEWIELYNRSDVPLHLKGWSISDGTAASGSQFLLSQPRIVDAHRYFVVAADSTILALRPSAADILILNKSGGLSLGNDGDVIVLKDLTGTTIDSVAYRPSWHTPDVMTTRGRSLERINPDHDGNDGRNWGTSAASAGSSPGEQNSLYARHAGSEAAISFSPNPFSPDADGFEDVCIISYRLPASTSVLRVRIFDRVGRLIRTLADGVPSGASGEIIWNGYDADGRRARIGPYIVLLESADNRGGIMAAIKGVIVVATKL